MDAASTGSIIGRRLAQRAIAVAEHGTVEPAATSTIDLTHQPSASPPAVVRQAAHAALDRGETHYTARPGIPQLCAALAARSTEEGFPAEPGNVVVTNGGAEALYIALQSVVQPGSRVLLTGPASPNVATMVRFVGGVPEQLTTAATTGFNPTAEAIAGQTADVLVLASPSPISGVAIPPDELAQIATTAIERGMTVVLDRSLAWCCYDPELARFPDPTLGSRLLTAGSFSHAYDMAGWRAGYFTAPAEHGDVMLELKQAMSICTSAITQYAALAAVEEADDWLADRRETMLARRDAVIGRLEEAGLFVIVPDAWPYLLLDTRLIHPDDRQAAAMLREQAGVAVEPASPYSPSLAGYTRMTLSIDGEVLEAGLDRLIGFHNSCL